MAVLLDRFVRIRSIAADGLDLLVVSTQGGPVHHLGLTLVYPDYLTWCSGRLVYAPGSDRIAVHGKRLLVAAPPDWQPKPLWNDPHAIVREPGLRAGRDGGRGALAAHERERELLRDAVAALAGRARRSTHNLIDAPPARLGRRAADVVAGRQTLAFVRERKGYGRLMSTRRGKLLGPFAQLGYQLGYYGHHDWGLAWAK